MGEALGGMFGSAGGSGGTGFNTPSGTDSGQLQTAYQGAQSGIKQQQALLQALQAQNGLQNQTNTYNQLQGVASGQGPNPAQAMLNQTTGQNVANQAALMAGQRGAASNVGLMARQAAQQGANIQQQAAGQGASMQAQQSLNALGAMGNMANTMAGQQINQNNAISQAQQNEQQILQNANSANNQIQGNLANTRMGQQGSVLGGVMQSAGSALHLLAEGGAVSPGAYVAPSSSFEHQYFQSQAQDQSGANSGTSSNSGNDDLKKGASSMASGIGGSLSKLLSPSVVSGSAGPAGMADLAPMAMAASKGGKVPAVVSPGEAYIPPEKVKDVATKKEPVHKAGEIIPGKAKVKGDSYKNDTVRKDLDAGGVVIPRSVMTSKDPARGAADFVRAVIMKKGKK